MLRTLRSHVGVALLTSLALVACGGDDDNGTTDPPTTGDLETTVTSDGAPHAGATVRLFEEGGSSAPETQTTGSDGTATFSDLDEGAYEVEVVVPDGYALADGESERKSVTVTAGSTASRSFALVEDIEGEVVDIALSGTSFSPDDVTITPGTTVRWTNEDGQTHTVTPDGNNEWSEVTLDEVGETFTHTFEDVGTFDYYCTPHRDQGMTGVIRVEGS